MPRVGDENPPAVSTEGFVWVCGVRSPSGFECLPRCTFGNMGGAVTMLQIFEMGGVRLFIGEAIFGADHKFVGEEHGGSVASIPCLLPCGL